MPETPGAPPNPAPPAPPKPPTSSPTPPVPPKPATPATPAKPAAKPEPKAQRMPGPPPMPSNKHLDELRDKKFGNDPGSVQIDADPTSGVTSLVYVDGTGKEVGREPYQPPKEA